MQFYNMMRVPSNTNNLAPNISGTGPMLNQPVMGHEQMQMRHMELLE